MHRRRGTIVTGDVLGRVICKCKLSGMPDVAMSLTNPSLVEDPVFHPCVRYGTGTCILYTFAKQFV